MRCRRIWLGRLHEKTPCGYIRRRDEPELLSSAPARREEATMKNALIRFLAGAALAAASLPCAAQSYPAKPLLMLMPLQAGRTVDVIISNVPHEKSDDMS